MRNLCVQIHLAFLKVVYALFEKHNILFSPFSTMIFMSATKKYFAIQSMFLCSNNIFVSKSTLKKIASIFFLYTSCFCTVLFYKNIFHFYKAFSI